MLLCSVARFSDPACALLIRSCMSVTFPFIDEHYFDRVCRAVSASAATLALPQIEVPAQEKAPATSLPVKYADGALSAGGCAFIQKLGPSFFLNAEAAPDVGILLGLMASDGRPTSIEETTLGQLACDRCIPAHPAIEHPPY